MRSIPATVFSSENAAFAEACAAAGLVFIGPPAAAIAAMGNKARAKELMLAAGVPCVPGYRARINRTNECWRKRAASAFR